MILVAQPPVLEWALMKDTDHNNFVCGHLLVFLACIDQKDLTLRLADSSIENYEFDLLVQNMGPMEVFALLVQNSGHNMMMDKRDFEAARVQMSKFWKDSVVDVFLRIENNIFKTHSHHTSGKC